VRVTVAKKHTNDGENAGGMVVRSELSLMGRRDAFARNYDWKYFVVHNFSELHEKSGEQAMRNNRKKLKLAR